MPLIFYFAQDWRHYRMSPAASQNGPNSKINNFVLKLSVSSCITYSNHRNPPREWYQKLTYCESGFEPSFCKALMYDIPLLSNLISASINICFISYPVTGTKQKLEEDEVIRKTGHPCHCLNLMLANCLVLYYHIYPHVINFVWS